MTTLIKEMLTKVLSDLTTNRDTCAKQSESLTLQLEQNKSQVAHFDAVIAAVTVTLADEDTLEAALAQFNSGTSLPVDETPAPLPVAGSDAPPAAPAPADSSTGTDANGTPVASNPPATG